MRHAIVLCLCSVAACAHTPPSAPVTTIYLPAACAAPKSIQADKKKQIAGVETQLDDARRQAQELATNPKVKTEDLGLVQDLYKHAEVVTHRAKVRKRPADLRDAKIATEAVRVVTEVLKTIKK